MKLLKKNNLLNYPINIHFQRKTGISNSDLFTSKNGWLPTEYLWYDITIYFGEGPEKKYIGTVIDGQELEGIKYVIIKTKSGSTEPKKLDHIKNASYYIKADDPYIKTRILKFN
ncbi:MAG: hypothetical protein K0B37_07435 [Bacteroidales bacterium]|nr:hypothetical protein [Bacteroidales bacterium]